MGVRGKRRTKVKLGLCKALQRPCQGRQDPRAARRDCSCRMHARSDWNLCPANSIMADIIEQFVSVYQQKQKQLNVPAGTETTKKKKEILAALKDRDMVDLN